MFNLPAGFIQGSETESYYVAYAGLRFMAILLPQPPGCWDDRCELPLLTKQPSVFSRLHMLKKVGGGVQVKAMSTVHWDRAKELPVRGISGQWYLQVAGADCRG